MSKRTCFFIPVDQFDEHGYIPSLVTEGEAGHAPLAKKPPPKNTPSERVRARREDPEYQHRLTIALEETSTRQKKNR